MDTKEFARRLKLNITLRAQDFARISQTADGFSALEKAAVAESLYEIGTIIQKTLDEMEK